MDNTKQNTNKETKNECNKCNTSMCAYGFTTQLNIDDVDDYDKANEVSFQNELKIASKSLQAYEDALLGYLEKRMFKLKLDFHKSLAENKQLNVLVFISAIDELERLYNKIKLDGRISDLILEEEQENKEKEIYLEIYY